MVVTMSWCFCYLSSCLTSAAVIGWWKINMDRQSRCVVAAETVPPKTTQGLHGALLRQDLQWAGGPCRPVRGLFWGEASEGVAHFTPPPAKNAPLLQAMHRRWSRHGSESLQQSQSRGRDSRQTKQGVPLSPLSPLICPICSHAGDSRFHFFFFAF